MFFFRLARAALGVIFRKQFIASSRIPWTVDMTSKTLSHKVSSITARIATVSFGLLVTIMPAAIAFAITPTGRAFGQTEQLTPPEITPPPGNIAFLTAHARGTQNYICLPSTSASGPATVWTFLGPQATLSVSVGRHFRQQVSTHFLSAVPTELVPTAEPGCTLSGDGKQVYCPTWQSSFDSSAVWGAKAGSVNAGTDASCPHTGAIPCLLLKAVATKPGHFGTGLFFRTTYIQRLNTKGGAAPTASCKTGALALVPYTADYSFFAKEEEEDAASSR